MNNPVYEVIPIDGSSWRIEENGVRSFLFVGTDKALLVDTGFGSGDLKAVIAGMIYMFGSGRNMSAYITSLEKMRDMSIRFDKIYPSHGPFPVVTGIIHDLILGSKKILAGKLEGADPPHEADAKLYSLNTAKMLY
jgi:glyoxylase-like metal-dependent hydrolase (beta-lactamase superfamily II)